MDAFDENGEVVRIEAWAIRPATGGAWSARLVVRRLPSLEVVFEDISRGDGCGWSAEQALWAAQERGRQYLRQRALGKVVRADGRPCAPDEV